MDPKRIYKTNGKYMAKGKGFTLIELIVVICVIAIITSISMPPLLRWRTDANLRGAASNLAGDLEMAKVRAIRENAYVAVLLGSDGYTIFVDECEFGRLGQGMANSSQLHPDAIERSLTIVKRFREQLDEHETLRVACVATQAIREAENRDAFVNKAEEILGVSIEIITGQREAELVARAVANSFPEATSHSRTESS